MPPESDPVFSRDNDQGRNARGRMGPEIEAGAQRKTPPVSPSVSHMLKKAFEGAGSTETMSDGR